jgi:succinyl-CoA synthetase beta subunit
LLPPFDEYLLGYKDRELVLKAEHAKLVNSGGGIPRPVVLIQGQAAGIWHKEERKNEIRVNVRLFGQTETDAQKMIRSAGSKMSRFYRKPVSLNFS